MKTKALVKREEFKVKKVKDLFIKHGNHSSGELDSLELQNFHNILKENCLRTSLEELSLEIMEIDTFGRDLNMPRIKRSLLRVAILSLIVNEHLERQCYLEEDDC